MALLVFTLVALMAINGWTAGAEEVVKEPGQNKPVKRGEANPASESCPKGLRYKLKCNWCNCDPQVSGDDICSYRHCADWDCQTELESLHYHGNCFGHCECDTKTNYTMCELKGCPR